MKASRLNETQFAARYLPEVTADVVLLSISPDGTLCTILGQRDEEPFLGGWGIPGVFVGRMESIEEAALRALRDKVGVDGVFVEQLFTFGAVDRDPRGRVLSVAYYALVPHEQLRAAVAERHGVVVASLEVPWEREMGGPVFALDENGERFELAFDHGQIIGTAVLRIRGKLNYAPLGFELLPSEFTLYDLQRIHEAVLGRTLNKDSFRRRLLASGLIEDTGARRSGTSFRPASLYRFKSTKEN